MRARIGKRCHNDRVMIARPASFDIELAGPPPNPLISFPLPLRFIHPNRKGVTCESKCVYIRPSTFNILARGKMKEKKKWLGNISTSIRFSHPHPISLSLSPFHSLFLFPYLPSLSWLAPLTLFPLVPLLRFTYNICIYIFL